jgi:ABC-2 type transport system permease protein
MIAAIVRAQFLSMRSFRLGSSRRNALVSIITGLVWYGFWTVIAVAAFQYTSGEVPPEVIRLRLPLGFLLVMVYWQLAPMISASLGASLDLKKLLVYPVPRHKLFLVEVLLRVANAAEMLMVLAGGLAGLLWNQAFGGWALAPQVAACLVLFTTMNLLLSAGLRSLLERLLARKRIREVLVLVLVLTTALPRVLLIRNVRMHNAERWFSATENPIWPWTAASHLITGPHELFALVTIMAWSVVALAFGSWQFGRSLRFDAQAAEATDVRDTSMPEKSWSDRAFRLPGFFLPDPVAAMVEKELRSLTRTPRFRLVFIMGFSFGILVWLPLVIGRQSAADSTLAKNFLVLVSVYALTLLGQVSYWNAFGFDRSAAQVYFSLPVKISTALVGKNIAAAMFIFLEMSAVTAACLILRMQISGVKIIESYVVMAIAALYMLGIGNLSSVHYPRAMNPERVSQGGAASRWQALVFIFYPLALLPIFLAYVARVVFSSETAFLIVLAFAAVLGGVIYRIAMDSAVEAAARRKEQILAELSRTEGPVITE